MEPWTFGVEPLPQTMQVAPLLRRVAGLVQALEADDPAVQQLIAELHAAEQALVLVATTDPVPRLGVDAPDDARPYVDHARDVGAFNPCFPEYDIAVEGNHASGNVTFPIVFEGPPGLVHGGVLTTFFDSVIQHHNCDVGVAGKTMSLLVEYRRPTPLGLPLRFEIDRETEERRIASRAQLFLGDDTLCTATMAAVAGDRTNLPFVPAPPDGVVTALTVPALLCERAAGRAEHPLLICDDDVLSYADAQSRSAALARGLLAAGAGPGTHIGLLYPNGSAFVVGWLAAARIGAISIPLSTFSTAAELRVLLRNADIEVLLATPTFRGRDYIDTIRDAMPGLDFGGALPLLSPSMPALRRVAFDTDALVAAGATIDDDVLAAAEARVSPADRMVIVHTSGSTSEPKGVIHQHGALIRHLDNLNALRRYADDEVLFSNSPFFWIGGFAYSLLGTLLAGATLVCSNATDTAATLDLLERARPTMVNGFAAAVAHLAQDPSFATRDLTSIRRGNLWPIMPAGVRPRDPELRHNMLGMTEAGSVCLACADESEQPEHRRGSFGRPVPGFEAKIVDPDSGAELGAGAVGELWLRSRFLMEGYYGREQHETFTPDGWYRTGDLFHVDADGFFYFTGRRGDMIKTAGANVAPREVEATIAELTGLVAHVVGIDDPERGQLVAAAVRVPRGQAAPDTDALRVELRTKLSAYKVPQRYLVLADDDVPMLSSGKLDTRALKERFS